MGCYGVMGCYCYGGAPRQDDFVEARVYAEKYYQQAIEDITPGYIDSGIYTLGEILGKDREQVGREIALARNQKKIQEDRYHPKLFRNIAN